MQANGTPQQHTPPVDPGNTLLTEVPAMISVAQAAGPQGPRVILTIRTPSTTTTVLLNRDDALSWARVIRAEAQGISPLILPTNTPLN